MRTLGNLLWLLLAGVWLAIGYVVAGIINRIFIITIPFGIQSFKLVVGIPLGIASFKMAGLALAPFGKQMVPVGTVPADTPGTVQPPPSLA